MYCIAKFCFICREQDVTRLKDINSFIFKSITILDALKEVHPDINPEEHVIQKHLCTNCIFQLSISYNFKLNYIKGYDNFNFYMSQLITHQDANTIEASEEFVKEEETILDIKEEELNIYKELKSETVESVFVSTYKPKIYPCYYCTGIFSTEEEVKQHMRIHYKIKKPIFSTNSPRARRCPKKNHVNCTGCPTTLFDCPQCMLSFNTEEKKRKHVCPVKFKCKNLLTKANFNKHLLIHNTNILKRDVKCPSCEKCFRTKGSLKRHVWIHKIQCSNCRKSFRTNAALEKHILECHF